MRRNSSSIGAADSVVGEGLEADAQIGSEFAEGLHEAESACADQVRQFDVGRKLGLEMQGVGLDAGGEGAGDAVLVGRGQGRKGGAGLFQHGPDRFGGVIPQRGASSRRT
jgi:hypothetical protein